MSPDVPTASREGAPDGVDASHPPVALDRAALTSVLRRALAEDLAGDPDAPFDGAALLARDVTTRAAVPAPARARARLVAKEAGVVAGVEALPIAARLLDPTASWTPARSDGDAVEAGDVVGVLVGDARAMLVAERSALNVVQRLSGVATRAAACAARVAGTGARVLDTRKTTPGLRALEKDAVRAGGAANHRFGLFDEAMVKENHVELAGRPVEELLGELRAALGPDVPITCEARDPDEARAAVRGGADVVLLDNMPPEAMAALVPELRALAAERGAPLEVEASGGITEDELAAVAAAGVDRISIGALTHSAPALDLSLELEPLDGAGEGA